MTTCLLRDSANVERIEVPARVDICRDCGFILPVPK